jgi:hypothetical protein
MKRSIDNKILQDISRYIDELNKKIDRLIQLKIWMIFFKEEIEQKKVTPGVI